MKTKVVKASELDPKKGLRAENYIEGTANPKIPGKGSKHYRAMRKALKLAEDLNIVFFYPEKEKQHKLYLAGLPMPARASLKKQLGRTIMTNFDSINYWAHVVHDWSKRKGWWKKPQGDVSKKLLMMHSEISEATEDLRDAEAPSVLNLVHWEYDKHHQLKPIGFASELADLFIRLVDLAAKLDIDLAAMVELKMRFNEGRPYQHGGKTL